MATLDWLLPLLTPILPIAVIIYLLTNPEKAEQWGYILARLWAWVSARAERASVALELQSKIGDFCRRMSEISEGILPKGVKIRWEKQTTAEAFIEKGEAVVIMSHHRNNARNLVTAVVAMLSVGLLSEARGYILRPLMHAIELATARRILLEERRDALPLFNEEVVKPMLEDDAEAAENFSLLAEVDDSDLLLPILLPEVQTMGSLLSPKIIDPWETSKDVSKLVDLLVRVARRKRGEDIDLSIRNPRFKIDLMMIARPENYATFGIAPYTGWVSKCMAKGCDTIYVLAGGWAVKAAEKVLHDIATKRVLQLKSKYERKLFGKDPEFSKVVIFRLERL